MAAESTEGSIAQAPVSSQASRLRASLLATAQPVDCGTSRGMSVSGERDPSYADDQARSVEVSTSYHSSARRSLM